MQQTLRTAVIGAGLMGHGIALVLARAGHRVALADPSEDALRSAPDRIAASLRLVGAEAGTVTDVLARIGLFASPAEAVRDAAFVFEAAPEDSGLKQRLFAEIEAHAPATAVFASNTSVIPITKIMGALRYRERALGTHWWNPPHVIPLVEVIRTEWTAPEVVRRTCEFLGELGKTPVVVEKDVPGFIGNRLQHARWREAISLVEKGICSAEAVDTVIKASFGRRLAVLGPLENADLVGTDLTLAIHENVLADLDNRPEPSPYLRRLVAEGRLGMKTGEGFHRWTPAEADAVRTRVTRHLLRLETILGD